MAGEPSLRTLRCMTPRPYPVLIGRGALEQLAADLAGWRGIPRSSSLVIVTDATVWQWHGHRVLAALTAAGVALAPLVRVVPAGEASKSRAAKAGLEDWMLQQRCFRDTLVLAVGGGVVGDLAGFAASTYMRGVPVIQVPTTLLAMVDSAIGGKTGVDTPAGKNLVGSFHQPLGVYADTSFLATLPLRELVNGFSEVIKAGAVRDAALFELCERHAEELTGTPARARALVTGASGGGASTSSSSSSGSSGWGALLRFMDPGEDPAAAAAAAPSAAAGAPGAAVVEVDTRVFNEPLLVEALTRAMAVKVAVVGGDEREGGKRAILNFGHTIGHGLEALLQPASLHGECVAIGMVKEAEVARALGLCDSALVGRLARCLKGVGLPVSVPGALASGAGLDAVMQAMALDKKNTRDLGAAAAAAAAADPDAGVTFKVVCLAAIGVVKAPPFAHAVQAHLLRRVLSAAVTVLPPAPSAAAGLRAAAPVRLRAPGSKSVSNRALLLAGLAQGATRLSGLLASDDTQVMLTALQSSLGARVAWDSSTGDALITGMAGALAAPADATSAGAASHRVYVGNAGTASRFLASVLCLLPSLSVSSPVVLEGNARMAVRPIGPLVDALRAQGALISYPGREGCLPLCITRGISSCVDSSASCDGGAPALGHRLVALQGRISSQFVSSVLMAAPLFPSFTGPDGSLSDDGTVELVLAEEHPTSLPYITMTLATMARFGVPVTRLADNRYIVPRVPYTAPRAPLSVATDAGATAGRYEVEADASSASYAAAIAAVTGRAVVLEGVGSASSQGDAGFPALLGRMGATVTQGEHTTTITGPLPVWAGGPGLTALTHVDMAEQTDCFMTLAVVAAVAAGTTRITGIANQRVKECNRIAAMVTELGRLGVAASELPDGLQIEGCGGELARLAHGGTVHCYDDHRIAMSFGVLACVAPGIVIDDAACTEKTYPEFWDVLATPLGYSLRAASASPTPVAASVGSGPRSVVVIGMRGAGKSTLAAGAARWLGSGCHWRCVDLDRELEAAATADYRAAGALSTSSGGPVTVSQVVAAEGWDGFRARETAILRRVLSDPATSSRCVIACGGGVVESEPARALLHDWVRCGGVVVEVRRDVQDIQADLDAAHGPEDPQRPAYAGAASLAGTYARRAGWYSACSNAVFCVARGDRDWALAQASFNALLERLVLARGGGCGIAHHHSSGGSGGVGRPASVNGVPVVPRALPLAGTCWPVPPNAACGEGGDGSAFVCVSLPDLRMLSPTWRESAAATATGACSVHALQQPAGAVLDELGAALLDVAQGADGVELRADLLLPHTSALAGGHGAGGGAPTCCAASDTDEAAVLLFQLGLLRQGLRHGLRAALARAGVPAGSPLADCVPPPPVIWTVRTAAEGGRFTGDAAAYARLVSLGLRAGCEAVDIEAGGAWPEATRRQLAAEAASAGAAVIGSRHWPVLPQPSEAELGVALARCRLGGSAAVVKLVAACESPQAASDFVAAARRLHAAGGDASGATALQPPPPLVALCLGAAGQCTRVACAVLTPVTHPRFPQPAAAGQLSLRQVRAHRHALGLLRPRAHVLTGSPIHASLSPAMHTAAWHALAELPHAYALLEADAPARVTDAVRQRCAGGGGSSSSSSSSSSSPSDGVLAVGGANVTIPLKHAVVAPATLDELSPHAAAIGAVNTIVVTHHTAAGGSGSTRTRGDNSDWLGVALPLRAALAQRAAALAPAEAGASLRPPPAALIIGAGGAARAAGYAAVQLGLRPLWVNRTHAKAVQLAAEVGGAAVEAAALLAPPHASPLAGVVAVIHTLPPGVGWGDPPGWLLAPPACAVAFDMAYGRGGGGTPLLVAAAAAGCARVDGGSMLVVQAAAAAALWGGRAGGLLRGAGGGEPLAAGLDAPAMVAMAGAVFGRAN